MQWHNSRWTRAALSSAVGWFASRRKNQRDRRWLRLELLEARWVPTTITPTTFTDGVLGSGSLRDAVLQFNADMGTGDDTIHLLSGTYALTIRNTGGHHETAGLEGDLNITSTAHRLIVQGAGPSTVIDASGLQDRVFQIVNPGTRVVFRDLVIQGGLAQDDGSAGALAGSTDALGGGILNNGGDVTLDNVVVQNNLARGGDVAVLSQPGRNARGGGVYSTGGALTLAGATIANNQAIGGRGGDHNGYTRGGDGGAGEGGGLYAIGGSLDISDSRAASNRTTGGRGGDGYLSVTSSGTGFVRGGTGGAGQGGGLYVNGSSLTIATSTIASNQGIGGAGGQGGGPGSAYGGGLYNLGPLTVTNSILPGNSASYGGGIFSSGGTLTVSNSTLSSNSAGAGGGIDNDRGMLTVTDSTLSSNSAGNGGGISTIGTLTVSNSTLSSNSAGFYGGGIANHYGTLTVSNSTLSSNHANSGGAIANHYGTVTVSNSTLSSNSASFGGGIYILNNTVTVTDSTLTSNSAFNGGGGIDNNGRPLLLQNTIVAANRSTNSGPDISGAVSNTSSYNLVGIGDSTLSGISNGSNGNLVGSVVYPIDPRLGPLADNGGPTLTRALLPDSPARGAGSLNYATATDQRGLPRTVGGQIDQGAYQSQSAVAGPQVVLSDPGGIVDPPVDHVRLTFNHPMDPTSLTIDQFSLSGPAGSIALSSVTVVTSTNDQQFDVSFASQTQPGDYALVVGAAIRDIYGNPLGIPYTARFILFGLTGSTLTVNSTADTANPTDLYLTLREAIAIVNSPTLPTGLSPQILAQISGTLHSHNSDTIVFDTTQVSTPIRLGGTQLELSLPRITARITIAGGSGVTVDGNNASRVFLVDSGAQATLDHLTITHGRATGSNSGGGILNSGTLTLSNSTLSSNSGGGIYNQIGTLTVSNSTLSSNSAGFGGGIYNDRGTVTVTDSTLSFNSGSSGGGISTNYGTVTVSNSTLSSNSAGANGGGIYNSLGIATINNSTISFNFAGYQGGGISNYGTVTVSNSTLESNSADSGGGIHNYGTVTLSNSTLHSNSASSSFSFQGGGGIYNFGAVTVSNSTLSSNSAYSGGGIYNYGSTLHLQDTIVAGNRGTSSDPDISGPVSSTSSYNLVGNGTGLTGISHGVNHNQIGTTTSPLDPMLSPLADHGGPTQTYALLAGSPALDAGDPSLAGTPDQRGVIRGGGVNIGAFQASAASFVVAAPDSVTAGDLFDVSVSALDPFGQPAVGYTGTLSFRSADPHGASLPPDYTFTLADAGSHTFAGLSSLYTAGTWDVTVTDAINTLTGTTNVHVNAGSAVAFQVIAPATAASWTPFDVTVVAVDAYGNIDSHYSGTIHFTTSDSGPNVVLPPDYTFVADNNGTHTFPAGVTLITAGDQTLTVTDLTSGITGSTVVTL